MVFSKDQAVPGDSVDIATQSSPNAAVLLSVFDSSLSILADSCDSATADNVRQDHVHSALYLSSLSLPPSLPSPLSH